MLITRQVGISLAYNNDILVSNFGCVHVSSCSMADETYVMFVLEVYLLMHSATVFFKAQHSATVYEARGPSFHFKQSQLDGEKGESIIDISSNSWMYIEVAIYRRPITPIIPIRIESA